MLVADTMSRAGPGVRELVTSQEALKIGDEHVFRLDALAVPAEEDSKDAEAYRLVLAETPSHRGFHATQLVERRIGCGGSRHVLVP